jgi:hypothetical protein
MNATEPVLELDLAWRDVVVPMGVGAVQEGGTEVELLEVVEPDEYEVHDWVHVSVPLDAYVGQVPSLVVFAMEYPFSLTFIGNVRVVDGDGPPPGDIFPTGDPLKDGWYCMGYSNLDYYLQKYKPGSRWIHGLDQMWRGLIEAEGDVEITSSNIIAPPGLAREGFDEFVKESIIPPSRYAHRGEWRPIETITTHGGHIEVNGSRLTLTDSVVEHVPIIATEAEVEMDGATITGDADLVSLREPHGSIVGTSFTFETPRTGLPFSHFEDRYLWALAVCGTSPQGPLEIMESLFEGAELALDLSHADVVLAGNEFRSISELAVWDHHSTGLGTWEEVRALTTFEDCENYVFLRSQLTVVEVFHSEDANANLTIRGGSSLGTDIEIYGPIQRTFPSFHGKLGHVIVPTLLVTGDGDVQLSQGATTRFSWGEENGNVRIEVGEEHIRFDLATIAPGPSYFVVSAPPRVQRISNDPAGGAGMYNVETNIYLRYLDAFNVTMDIYLDSELIRTVDLESEGDLISSRWLRVNHSVFLVPGWHELHLSVWGNAFQPDLNYSDEPVELGNQTTTLFMPYEASPEDIDKLLAAHFVLLEPGVEVTYEHVGPFEAEEGIHRMNISGGAGSRLVLDGTHASGDPYLVFEINGNVSLTISNSTLDQLSIERGDYGVWDDTTAGDVELLNLTCGYLNAYYSGRSILISRVHARAGMYLTLGMNTTGRVEDSSFLTGYISLHRSDLAITRTDFEVYLIIIAHGRSIINVSECTFTDAPLGVFLDGQAYYQPVDVRVTECNFRGEEAFLYIGSDLRDFASYDDDSEYIPDITGAIEGNSFNGAGNDVVLHHGFFDALYGENQLTDGSRLYALYVARMQVIPPETTPSNPGFRLLEHDDIVDTWPFAQYSWWELDGVLLYDVTEDPAREADPPHVPVLLLSNGRYVRGFSSIDPITDNDEATYSERPDFDALLRRHIKDWPWPWLPEDEYT